MSQNHRKQVGGPRVEEGFPLWRNQSASRRNRLLEFRAGKMFVRENMVHPDTRKGMVYIYQDDEGVMHFCWMDRSRGVAEDDLHTMPADCSYKRIEKCTTGRVYMLKMKSSNRALFFWMQEPSTANDLHICNKVNSLLNFPPPRMMFPEQIFNNELQFILNQLNSEQLHALYNGDDIVWVDARNQPPEVEQPNAPPPPPPSPPLPSPFVNLGEVVNEESVKTISKNPALMRRLEGKMPSIEGDQKNNLEDTVKSFTFKHAIEDFSLALKQGTSGQPLRELNVNSAAVAAAEKGDVDSFIKALQEGSVATSLKKGGSSLGPGNSGSPGRKPKDPSSGSNGKDGEGSRKESAQKEEKGNNKQTNGESRKRNYDGISREAIKVNSAQQTEPIIITSLVQSVGPEMKVTRKLAQLSIQSNDLSLEKSQNTDPVQIGGHVSIAHSSTYDKWSPGTSVISKLGSHKEGNVHQTQPEITSIKFVDGSGNVGPRTHVSFVNADNQVKMTTSDPGVESKVSAKYSKKLDQNYDTKLPREGERIELTNDNEKETNKTLRKRANEDSDETNDPAKNKKRIKFDEKYLAAKVTRSKGRVPEEVQDDGSDGNNTGLSMKHEEIKHHEKEAIQATNEFQRELSAKLRKRLHVDKDETKAPDNKMMKFEDSQLENKSKVESAEELQHDGNERSIIKVEGEQQTEPVRIKSAPSTGAETKITTKRASARGQRADGSMERSQNTDPVLIEEKQKRQSKPKDPKPPEQE